MYGVSKEKCLINMIQLLLIVSKKVTIKFYAKTILIQATFKSPISFCNIRITIKILDFMEVQK